MPHPLCFDTPFLQLFLNGHLSSAKATEVAEHLMECKSCATVVHRLRTDVSLLDTSEHRTDTEQTPVPFGDQQSNPEPAPKPPSKPKKAAVNAPHRANPQPNPAPRQAAQIAQPKPSPPAKPAANVQQARPASKPQPAVSQKPANITNMLAAPQQPDELGRVAEYRILKVLGEGGMGVVFLAEDMSLSRNVALKMMKKHIAADKDCRHRFLREARATAKLNNDHIVQIYCVGEENGMPYFVMPLLDGNNLKDYLANGRMLTVSQTVRLGIQIAEGLSVAHEADLIHRDIKPDNIWIEPVRGGRVKVLDFGLARNIVDQRVTQTGQILGTPSYMAPEQARGEEVDQRCDLFSMGCVLYEMCTGVVAFDGPDIMSILASLGTHQPLTPRSHNANVPQALSDLIMHLLSKDREARPKSALDVLKRLRSIQKNLGSTSADADAVPMPKPESTQELTQTVRSRNTPKAWKRPAIKKPLPWWIVIVGVAVLVLIGFIVLLLATRGPSRTKNKNGRLHITVSEPDVLVSIRQNGKTIIAKTKNRSFSLGEGGGEIDVYEKDGALLLTKPFAIKRGKSLTIRVTPGDLQTARAAISKKKSPVKMAWQHVPSKWQTLATIIAPNKNGPPKIGVTMPYHWRPIGFADLWENHDGVITATGFGSGWLSTAQQYGDFEFQLEYCLQRGAKSGVYLRVPQHVKLPAPDFVEMQIIDDHSVQGDNKLRTGALVEIAETRNTKASKKAGQWNQLVIRVQDLKIHAKLNDVLVQDSDLQQVNNLKPSAKRTKGYIGLQCDHTQVKFRNLQIRTFVRKFVAVPDM